MILLLCVYELKTWIFANIKEEIPYLEVLHVLCSRCILIVKEISPYLQQGLYYSIFWTDSVMGRYQSYICLQPLKLPLPPLHADLHLCGCL